MKWYEKQSQWMNKQQAQNKSTENGVTLPDETMKSKSSAMNDNDHDAVLNSIIEVTIQDYNSPLEAINTETTFQQKEPQKIEKTTISTATKIIGNIESDDILIIDGTVLGNIKCSQSVIIHGHVEGDLECYDVQIYNAHMKGNITSKANVEILPGCEIQGFVTAEQLQTAGKIEGDVSVEGLVVIQKGGTICGDIKAQELEIERGSIIKGNLNIQN